MQMKFNESDIPDIIEDILFRLGTVYNRGFDDGVTKAKETAKDVAKSAVRVELEKSYNDGWQAGFAYAEGFYKGEKNNRLEKSTFNHIASDRSDENQYDAVLRDLEATYSGAKMFDDISTMVRTARAIEAFKLPTDKDCVIQSIKSEPTNEDVFFAIFGFKPKSIYDTDAEWWDQKYEGVWREG
jgi:hypothetical protein